MKKITIYLLFITYYLLLSVVPLKAQEELDETRAIIDQMVIEPIDLGVLKAEEKFLPIPGSPLYFFQGLREKFEDMLARTPEKKAEVAMRQARRRLLEMDKLLEEEVEESGISGQEQLGQGEAPRQMVVRPEKVERKGFARLFFLRRRGENVDERLDKLQERYEDRLKRAEDYAEKVGEKRDEVKNKILEKRQAQQQVLQRVLEKAPGAARPALQRVLERHQRNVKRFMERWEARGGRIEERLKRRQEKLKERFERRKQSLEKLEERPVQMRQRPAVIQRKKILGVFDRKSLLKIGWEMVKKMAF